MTDVTTPIGAGAVVGDLIGGKIHGFNLLNDTAGADAMGIVGTTPAANTLLGRLKAIADAVTAQSAYVDGLEALATTLNGYVDTLESLIGTTNTSLTAISGYVDGLEGLSTSLNGYVDGLETLHGSTNTILTSIQGYVDGLETLLGAATPAGENVIGALAGNSDLFDVTLTLDTSVYASGDVLADTQALTNVVRVNGGRAVLQSIAIIDDDDQGVAFDLLFFGATQTLGTENATPSITDSAAHDFQGLVSIASTDYIDLGANRVVSLKNIGILLEAAAGSRDLFIAAIARGAGTYTGSGIRVRLGLVLG